MSVERESRKPEVEDLIDDFIDYLLDTLRPQMDGQPPLSPKQHRVLRNECHDFAEAVMEQNHAKTS
jgi:hypothetical protein